MDISAEKDSFNCHPSQQNVITKLSFATEESLYRKELAAVPAAPEKPTVSVG